MGLSTEEIDIIIGIIVFVFGLPIFFQLFECISKCPCLLYKNICIFSYNNCCIENPIKGSPFIV